MRKEAKMAKETSIALAVVGIIFSATVARGQAAESWAIKANITESCSCDPACPCMFGSPMTNETCEGSRLYEIEEGHFGGVSLDGLKVIATFRLGNWVKYYVSNGATDEQLEAVEPLISHASPVFDVAVLGVQKASISVERTDTRVKFAGPESTVEIELMEGLDGKPIRMQNLPFDDLVDYVQYKSVENSHKSPKPSFKHSDTNGFTSRVDKRG
jgi:hypothetical protein